MKKTVFVPSGDSLLCKKCGRHFYDHPVEQIYGPGTSPVARCSLPDDPAEQERMIERQRMSDLCL